eukprot:21129-Heterococcus_DN1.PRE.2
MSDDARINNSHLKPLYSSVHCWGLAIGCWRSKPQCDRDLVLCNDQSTEPLGASYEPKLSQ